MRDWLKTQCFSVATLCVILVGGIFTFATDREHHRTIDRDLTQVKTVIMAVEREVSELRDEVSEVKASVARIEGRLEGR